jgi:hypothetical protein
MGWHRLTPSTSIIYTNVFILFDEGICYKELFDDGHTLSIAKIQHWLLSTDGALMFGTSDSHVQIMSLATRQL